MPQNLQPQRQPDRPLLLLTGFGPFPTVAANATSILVPRIAEATRRAVPGIAIAAHILPTEWEASLWLLGELTNRLRPTVALHFGVSGRATGFEIETRGRNHCNQSEDAAGRMPQDERISPGGPEFLPATLPAAHIVGRLRRLGLPAHLSRDAGGYLCNALLYRSLEISRALGAPGRSGFVHLPSNLVNERRPTVEPRPSGRLSWDDVVAGSLEIVAGALGRRPVTAASRLPLSAPLRTA
jgi:pyroglutamyl-peptidase